MPTRRLDIDLPWGTRGKSWTACTVDDCNGEIVPSYEHCIIHLADDDRKDYRRKINSRGPLSLSGLTINGEQLESILDLFQKRLDSEDEHRKSIPGGLICFGTVFTERVDMQHFQFHGPCDFSGATFQSDLILNGAEFLDGLMLTKAVVRGKSGFTNMEVRNHFDLACIECDEMLILGGTRSQVDLDLRVAVTNGIFLSNALFMGAVDADSANFSRKKKNASFIEGIARLDGAVFRQDAAFTGVRFPYETTFGGYADMEPAQFERKLILKNAQFGAEHSGGRHLLKRLNLGNLELIDVTFFGTVSLEHTTVKGVLELANVKVKRGFDLDPPRSSQAKPTKDTNFRFFSTTALEMTRLTVGSRVYMSSVQVEGALELELISAPGGVDITDLAVTEYFKLLSTTFDSYVSISVVADEVIFNRCQFTRGGVVACGTQRLSLNSCDARQPLTFVAPVNDADSVTRLTNLTYSNAENMILSNIAVDQTIFAGGVNLDKLKLEGAIEPFLQPRIAGRRQIVRDEAITRSTRSRRWRKYLSFPPDQQVDPRTTAATYRALRKGREDAKDEPGGADFYYGEMEMRRLVAKAWSFEKILLTTYWLISGYGLRAWRAIVSLVSATIALAWIISRHGYVDDACRPLLDSWLSLIQVSISLDRPSVDLSLFGQFIVILSRIMTPGLLALAFLAIRARIKR